MFTEALPVAAAILVAAAGVGVQWYNCHLDRVVKNKKKEKQEAEYSTGSYVAGSC